MVIIKIKLRKFSCLAKVQKYYFSVTNSFVILNTE